MEYAALLPQRMKLRGLTTKYILREAMRGILPDAILTRRKMGFPVPVGRWFAGEFRHVLDEYVLGGRASERGLFHTQYVRNLVTQHERGEGNHAERLWALVNTEIWQRIFLDGETPDDASAAMARLLGAHARGDESVAARSLAGLPLTEFKT
jgi:asparagine synthase (glutamine-hydrolysing)